MRKMLKLSQKQLLMNWYTELPDHYTMFCFECACRSTVEFSPFLGYWFTNILLYTWRWNGVNTIVFISRFTTYSGNTMCPKHSKLICNDYIELASYLVMNHSLLYIRLNMWPRRPVCHSYFKHVNKVSFMIVGVKWFTRAISEDVLKNLSRNFNSS